MRALLIVCALAARAEAGLESVELEGPHADLAAVCSGEERAPGCTAESPFSGGRRQYQLRAPWREVVLYGSGMTREIGVEDCRIAVRLADGWWVGRLAEECRSYGELGGAPHHTSRVRSVRVSQLVPGGPRELLVRIERERFERGDRPPPGEPWWMQTEREELLVICAVADGAPRCTEPITTRYKAWEESERGRRTLERFRLLVDYRRGLRIRFRGRGKPHPHLPLGTWGQAP